MVEMIERGDANLAGVKPGDALAVGRDSNLRDGTGAAVAGKDLIEPGGSGRRGRGCGLGMNGQRREEGEEDESAQ